MPKEVNWTGVATVNGSRLVFESAGVGRTVVLVHAGICDRRMWDAQAHRYAERFCVVRYDMRGFGDSPMVAGPFSHAEDLVALLDYLEMGAATVIGASMGGGVALDVALTHPDRVDALVTVGASPGGFDIDEPELDEVRREAQTASEHGDLDRLNEIELRIWVDGTSREPGDVDPAVRASVSEMNRRALQLWSEVRGEEREPSFLANDRLGELTIPVLAVAGNLDTRGAVEGSKRIAAGVVRGRFADIPGTAHLPSMEQPRAFDGHVLPFLAALD